MKQLLNLLLKAAAAMLLVAAVQPAGAGIVGPGACKSWLPGVDTLVKTPKHKECWPDCLTSISARHDHVKITVVEFTVADFDGGLKLAVVPNDSRLSGSSAQIETLQKGGNTSVSNWHRHEFSGLMPRHYYTVVIYSDEGGYSLSKPFFRTCFLTNEDPKKCQDYDAESNPTPRC